MLNRTSQRRRAVTLVELTVSTAVAVVLIGGLASAVVIASRAIPDDQSPSSVTIDGYYATEQIAGELLCAQSFTERSATTVEFTVSNRDKPCDCDTNPTCHPACAPETIRYEWSGTPGDALTRQYNGGSSAEVAQDVHEFALTYGTRTETTTTTETTIGQSDDIELAFFDNWPGIDATYFVPSPSRWMAEYFQPSFPDGVTTLNISRVQLMMREDIENGGATISVGIHRPATPGDPQPEADPIGTPAVRLTTTLEESYSWTDFTFSDVVIDTSDTELVIVVKGSVLGTARVHRYVWTKAPVDTTIHTWTTDSGASWDPRASAYDDYDMPFHIYGTYETETTQEIETTRYFLQSVEIALRVGPNPSTRVETSAQVLNTPEVASP